MILDAGYYSLLKSLKSTRMISHSSRHDHHCCLTGTERAVALGEGLAIDYPGVTGTPYAAPHRAHCNRWRPCQITHVMDDHSLHLQQQQSLFSLKMYWCSAEMSRFNIIAGLFYNNACVSGR